MVCKPYHSPYVHKAVVHKMLLQFSLIPPMERPLPIAPQVCLSLAPKTLIISLYEDSSWD